MAINQEARIPVYLNDEQAKQALKNLTSEAEKWRKKMHQAMAAGDPKGVKQAEREMKKATAAANKLKRETFDVDKVLQNLSRASVADLRKALNRLRSEQRLLNRDTKEYKAISKQIGAIKGEFSKVNGAITRQRGLMGRLTGSVKGLLPAFGFFAIIQGLRRVASITIEFQKAQSNLAAVLGKTRQEIKDLADDAIRYGSVTAFTASQVTELQTAFARLGFSQNQIKASTRATLDLAAATNAELGPAAETVAVALNAFGLSAEHAGEVAATLAVGTSRSALAFADYQTILSTVGPVSRAFGFSLEETVALTGKLRDAGFDASSAATATRNIFLNLADSSGKLAQALGRPIRSLDDLAPALAELRTRGIDLNETLQLTDKRSVAAFNTFLGATDTMLDLRDSVTGVTAELQEMVEVQLDNVAGDITILKSAWQGFILSIEQGDGVLARFTRGTLKFFTDSLIKLANIDLIFKRAGKFTADEVADVYDAMLNLSGRKYKKFQELVKQENKLALDQVILRKDAMIEEIRATGQSRKEAELLWQEFYNRQKEQSINAIRLKKEEEKKEEEKAANELLNQQKKADEKFMKQRAEALKIAELLEADRETQMAAIRAYFSEAGEGAFEAFIAAIEKEAQASDVNVALKLQKKEEEADDPTLDYALQKHQETLDYKLAMNQAMYDNSLIGEQQYQHQLTELTRQAEEERLTIKKEKIEAAQDLAYLGANFVMALMDMELEKTGEDEEKKAAIRKKYANVQFMVTASQIIVDTAAAIMKALAQLGPIGGPIAAGLIGATGAAQLAIANAERAKMKGFEKGGYTGSSDSQIAGIVHANEFVANADAVRNPTIKPFLDLINLAQQSGNIATFSLPGAATKRSFSSGGYTTPESNTVLGYDPEMKELIRRNIEATERLMTWKPKVYTEMIKKDLENLEMINRSRGL